MPTINQLCSKVRKPRSSLIKVFIGQLVFDRWGTNPFNSPFTFKGAIGREIAKNQKIAAATFCAISTTAAICVEAVTVPLKDRLIQHFCNPCVNAVYQFFKLVPTDKTSK